MNRRLKNFTSGLALALGLLLHTSNATAQADPSAGTLSSPTLDESSPGCATYDELIHDLRYGNCDEFRFYRNHRGQHDLCPDVFTTLNDHPEKIVADIIAESSDPEPFASTLKCKYIPGFISKGINHLGENGETLLHKYARNCDRENILIAKALGAKSRPDRHGQTPEDILNKWISHQQLAEQLESKSAKVAKMQKQMDKCANALVALTEKTVTLDDLRPLDLPLESKIDLAEYGKAHDTVTQLEPNRQTASINP